MTPYHSSTQSAGPQSDGLGQNISRVFIATIIPVFGLFVLRLILASLPMIKNAGSIGDTGVTPLLLIKASLDSVAYFLVIRFCFAVSEQLKALRPHLSEIATIILLAGCALVATLAYSGYEGLMAALAPAQMEVYNWLFLATVLAPIAMIVVLVTRRLDFFTSLLFGKLNEATAMPVAYAAAAGAPGAGRPMPPAGPPPGADPAMLQMRERVNAISQQMAAAREAAEKLRSRGQLQGELAESTAKMHGYFDGAMQSLEGRDLAAAKSFADWAEYEASRLLQAVN